MGTLLRFINFNYIFVIEFTVILSIIFLFISYYTVFNKIRNLDLKVKFDYSVHFEFSGECSHSIKSKKNLLENENKNK